MKKAERHTKRTMWFGGQNVPILYGSDREDIYGSEVWTARGTIQRIGTIIIAAVFFCGSLALFVASFLMMRGNRSEMPGGFLGAIVGSILALFAFIAACGAMFLAVRLIQGLVRSFEK